MRYARSLLALCSSSLLAAVLACGPGTGDTDPRVVSEIAPVSPTGTVAGYVYDVSTGAPLQGVSVTLPQLAGKAASTGADGNFRVDDVPASEHLAVQYRLEGHASASDEVTVPSSAGNLAQENAVGFSGPVGLFPIVGAGGPGLVVAVAVEDEDGAPISAASVTATLDVAWLIDDEPRGSLTVLGAADGASPARFELQGLPDLATVASLLPGAALRIVVVPEDPALRPAVLERTAASVASERVVVAALSPVAPPTAEAPPFEPDTPLELVDSNVADLLGGTSGSLPSVLSPDESIQLVFNRPIDPSLFFATLVDGRGRSIALAHGDGASVNVELPIGTPLPEGGGAHIFIEAYAEGAATSALAPVRRSGFALFPPADGALGFASFDANQVTHSLHANGNPVAYLCPQQPGELNLTLNARIGGRDANGAGLPIERFLPVRVTSLSAPPGNSLDPVSGQAPVMARLVADGPVAASGYTTRLSVPWPGVSNASSGQNTFDYQLRVEFNDLSLATGNQDQVVRAPGGAPVSVLEGTVTIRIAEGCNP